MKAKETPARRITRNTLFLGLSDMLARLSTWGLVAFLGRHWTVSLYGEYAVAITWVGIFAVAGELGLNALTVREVAHKKKKASFFLRHVLVLRSSFSLLFWGALIGLAFLLRYETVLILAIGVMGLRLILDSMEGGYIYLFQAHQEMGPYAVVNVLGAVIRLVGVILVVWAGGQIVGAGAIWTLASGVAFLTLMVWGHRRGWRPRLSEYRLGDSWNVLRMAFPLATFGALQTLYYRVDSVILKSLSGNEAVGFYDMATRVLLVVIAISQYYSQAIYPAFSSLQDKKAEFSRLAFKGTRFLFLLGLPLAVGGYF
ncbi:MAG TPA: oligosaccharide flippase family protein, partial [bacterium]|nr:oligosaccharide flippase family protein [bacterium]